MSRDLSSVFINTLYAGRRKMATSDDWLYNDDLEVAVPGRDRLDTETQVLEGEDLLDDIITAPSSATLRTHTPTNEDELLGVSMKEDNPDAIIEDSGSARYNAERKAKTVQARIEANRTSQGVATSNSGLGIFSREPNRKNSVYIGNMNWWSTDLHVIAVVREHGLGEVTCLKFFENRANGQSKGYCLVELESEPLAQLAPEKLQNVEIHDRKLIVAHALRVSPHQFESKCSNGKDSGSTPTFPSTSSSSSSSHSLGSSSSGLPKIPKFSSAPTILKPTMPVISLPMPNPMLHQFPRPPALPGFPTPPLPGLRPPGLPNLAGLGMPPMIPPPFPPIPSVSTINPFANRIGSLPTMPPFPPAALAGLGGAGGLGDSAKLPMGGAPHLNPAFLQEMAQGGNMAEMLAQAAARFRNQAAAFSGMGPGGHNERGKPSPNHPSDEEVSETNQRNKAISSSAITRAMADAQAGDYEGAIDTLRMAITLIKQSVTASSEASQIMIQSLQDCLQGMEQQASMGKRYRSSGSGNREHASSRHMHMHDMRDMRENLRDMRDERGMRSGSSSHKPSKHHRDRSRERRR